MQHVSPSKSPYVGFSPVRLQTGIQPRPSPTTRGLINTRSVCTNATLTYKWLKRRSCRPWPCTGLPFVGSCEPIGLVSGNLDEPVQTLLAHQRFMLSAGSMLTMASSETLDSFQRLMYSSMGLCLAALYGLESRGSPIYSA